MVVQASAGAVACGSRWERVEKAGSRSGEVQRCVGWAKIR